ncbi:TPA: transglycosylase SLT domain-containing protein [Acinetobacter baumannii]|uniref:transglycosylase SLT domain-containing protein n=1 Tax=Acinetobacter baumannii TaxID=470 RepID=UPI0004509CD2|nr:transglycosylase SLT domain-containing protein [Acinetobacter baumannii]EXA69427.1 transglycosylase SLT domain protein [Acinetobacter baumannii 984213]MBS4737528.1 transglycosylase SLT domain-containing protein [Acinetobacter baumannii]MCH1775421.1 transglycosylase SLT domain-containing protein [Acinetobacter baumannii]MCR0004668.1 transglycosylase SLT domain-containing protein [Acinetobacter baumannii]HCQ9654374.1 transglycosylase SLT domain-containing protein [Acinetobacter baumannii]
MRIPQFNRQVSDNSVPNVQVNGGMSAGEAASLVGNKTDSLVGALNSSLNAYQAYQDEADRVRVIDAQNKLAELKLHLQNNDVDGYGNKKGVDVVSFDDGNGGGFVDYYTKAYQDGVGQIANTLGNSRQRALFKEMSERDAVQFKGSLQNYFVRENDVYQQSVYSSSADRFIREINENPGDFTKIDESRANLKASLGKLMNLEGKAATEAENIYLKNVSVAHITNISAFVENGDLKAALAYKNKYKDEISLADSFKVDQRIHQKLEDQQVESLVNMATTGTQEGSNPALNVPPQASAKIAQELKSLTPDQMKNIKYNDQRLDVYTVHAAKEKGMEWAAPLILGLRLAGEKSNNSAVSEKGAKSVMQFMPETWKQYSKGGQRDINNPADTIDAAFDFISDISKKYKTKDPMVIAAYYHGGDEDARRVLAGGQPKGPRGRAYLERMDKWLSQDFGDYAKKPAKTREQAYEELWNSNVPVDVKQKALSLTDRYYNGQDKAKEEKQNQVYDYYFKEINSGQFSYEQIPGVDINALEPNQIKSLEAVSNAKFKKDIKTDPMVYSMIMLNKDELFKGKPQSVLHQYADKLSPSDYRAVTKMYIDVNASPKDARKEDAIEVSPKTVSDYLNPYLPMLGITNKTNKNQIDHYAAVQADVTQTLREAEARKGSKLTKDEFSRAVLKTIGLQAKERNFRHAFGFEIPGTESMNQKAIYSVKSKDDIAPNYQKKIDGMFEKQGRDLSKVTLAEYLNAYYSMMRRGF